MVSRKTIQWKADPNIKLDKFDHETLDSKNLVNQLLVITGDDITFSVIMDLFGEFQGKSLCHPYDTFTVPAGTYKFQNKNGRIVSNKDSFTTTIGLWIFNIAFVRDMGFGSIFGYITETIGKKQFGKFQQKLAFALLEEKITVEQYKKFLDLADWFMPFETILSPNHTEAILTCTKKINAKKAQLYKQYKEQLDAGDIAASEKMEKELLDYAKEILGDDPGLDPLSSGAGGDWGNNFKNLYVMRGAVLNPDPNAKQKFDVAISSYIDGISADEYSVVGNTLAKGAYSRAKKTETGGYWENLVSDATSTITIDPPGSDCGTDKYGMVYIDPNDYISVMYNYIIKNDGTLEELTSDNIDKYLGKTVKMRLSHYCKSKTGFCHHCAGNFFYRRGSNKAGLALSLVPNKLKLTSLKAFHSSVVNTYEIDVQKAFFN